MKDPPTQADALMCRARRLLSDHRTRAKKNGAALDYGLAEVRALLAANPLCEYCRMPVSFAASLDHRQPIARGGRHVLGNLALCCGRNLNRRREPSLHALSPYVDKALKRVERDPVGSHVTKPSHRGEPRLILPCLLDKCKQQG